MRSDKNKKRKAKTGERRIPWKRILQILIGLILALIIVVGVYVCVIIAKTPKIDTENITDILSESTVIYDSEGNEIDTVYSSTDRTNVKYEDLPEDLVNAFVSLEDKTFWDHHGFNFVRIAGAVVESVFTNNPISGTSTITQQLSRNLFLHETRYEHDYTRKIQEAYYSVILEKELTKEQILEAYLNTIDFGYHSSGVQAASQAYFSKDVKDLTLEECAALAPLAQLPTHYALVEFVSNESVATDDQNILKRTPNGTFIINNASDNRRNTCLTLMEAQGYITKDEMKAAKKKTLKDMLNPDYKTPTGEAAYFADYVISQVIDDLIEINKMSYEEAQKAVYNGGLRIYSTLDSEAQAVVEAEFDNPANFPDVYAPTDSEGNIVKNGQVALYDYDNYFDEKGNFTFTTDEISINKDGSLTIKDGYRLNIYNTEVNGTKDYSVEFKSLYTYEDDVLYSIAGGFINIPQEYKSRNDDGNVIVDASFFKDYKDFFIFNDDGTVTIPASSYSLNQRIVQPQAAMTIVENSTGHIKAMVGGRCTTGRMLFNRATSTKQPGSSIKPLGVYAPAIEQSGQEASAGKKHQFVDLKIDEQGADMWGDYLTAGSVIIDEKTHIEGRDWPQNITKTFSGPVTMRTAMAKSLNTCAVKTFFQVGTDYSYNTIEKFGISTLTDADRNPAALALGGMSHGVSTLEMASAYTVFPNNGKRVDTSSYIKVVDRSGKTVLSKEAAKVHDVISPGAAWIMTDMLRYVVTSNNAGGAAISGVPTGGKTGTTDEQVDLWFDGFTPNYSASLWMGTDQNLSLTLYSDFTAKIWGKIMNQISNAKVGSLPGAPSSVVHTSGEYFINGTQTGLVDPKKLEEEVIICEDTGYLATPDCLHVKKEKVKRYGKDKEKAPKYHCNKHNPDVTKYPIDPEVKLEVKPEEPALPVEPENPDEPGVPVEPEDPGLPIEPEE